MSALQLQPMTRKLCHALYQHWQNDAVKGKGYGTQAERLAVRYAFEKLGMKVIHADAILKNTRSQHVLEKVGFCFVGQDGAFKYYRMER